MKRLFAQVASAAFFIAPALAEPQYPTTPPAPPPPAVVILDPATGLPLGTASNPLNVTGGGGPGGSITSFLSSGSYLNVASVAFTSANSALPTGTNVVLYNYGGYKIIYQLSASGASTVTAATADGVLQPGGTIEVAVGTNTNIAYATTSSGLTSSLQVVGGTGLWTGSQNNNLAVGLTGIAGPLSANEVGGLDNSGFLQSFGVTAAGTSSTKPVVGVQGVTSGIPFLVNPGTATLWGLLTQGSTTAAQVGNLMMGAVTTAAPTYTTAQTSPISLDLNGNVRVNGGVVQGNLTPIFTSASSQTQLLVAAVSGKTVTVTGFHCVAQGSNTNTADCQLVQGTGATCGTGQTALSEEFVFTPGNGAWPQGLGPLFIAAVNNGVCVKTTTSSQTVVGGIVAAQQ